METLDYRKVEIKKNGKWIEYDFSRLKKGDIFRLYEKTGEIVKDDKGNTEFVATSEPYLTAEGILSIKAFGISKEYMN